MFGNQLSSDKRSPFNRSIWLIVLGLGVLLLYVQSTFFSNSQNQNQADIPFTLPIDQSNSTEASSENILKEPEVKQSLLPEYNPQAHPFFSDNPPNDRPLWLSGGDLALKLLFVLGLVYLVLAGLRWLQGSQRRVATSGVAIRVLETIGLTPGRTLHLIVVGEKILLIGATDHQISLLAELADVATPLVEENSPFDETLSQAKAHSKTSPSLDWHMALENLRVSVQSFRQRYQTD